MPDPPESQPRGSGSDAPARLPDAWLAGQPRGGYDLHVHTTASDGTLSPAEAVIAASRVGLAGLAVTDHDTVAGLADAQREAAFWKITLIPGIEFSATLDGVIDHLLAYFIDTSHAGLASWLGELRRERVERLRRMALVLECLGYRIDLPAVLARARGTPGRPHLAAWLVESGQVATEREAFDRLLTAGAPAFVPAPGLDAAAALERVRAAGGVAVLAHPERGLTRARLEAWRVRGLAGVEVACPAIPKARRERLAGWAAELDLVPTAGTDFHSPRTGGRWIGAIATPAESLERLRARRAPAVD